MRQTGFSSSTQEWPFWVHIETEGCTLSRWMVFMHSAHYQQVPSDVTYIEVCKLTVAMSVPRLKELLRWRVKFREEIFSLEQSSQSKGRMMANCPHLLEDFAETERIPGVRQDSWSFNKERLWLSPVDYRVSSPVWKMPSTLLRDIHMMLFI